MKPATTSTRTSNKKIEPVINKNIEIHSMSGGKCNANLSMQENLFYTMKKSENDFVKKIIVI